MRTYVYPPVVPSFQRSNSRTSLNRYELYNSVIPLKISKQLRREVMSHLTMLSLLNLTRGK